MRKLLLFFAMLFVSVGMRAAITITAETTPYAGYGIYGAKAGELAQLLSGTYTGVVEWNGATLDQLKSAEYVKVGSTSTPNILTNDDLEALELLSGAKFLDIDGSVLDEGADITKIKAGSAIEAVTLPNCLTKEKVNTVGKKLATINSNFGSCLSLDAELEPRELTTYTYIAPCSSEVVEYTGTVTDGKGHIVINRPLTLTSSSFSYTNTKFKNEVTACSENDIQDGYAVPNLLKVEVTEVDNPTYKYTYTYPYNNVTYDIPDHAVTTEGVIKDQNGYYLGYFDGNNHSIPYGTQVDVQVTHNYSYTYTFMEGYNEVTKTLQGTPDGDAINGYYTMVANNYSPGNGYRFEVSKEYNYTYTDLDCNEATISYNDGPHETINLSNNYEVDLTATTQTINVPKEGVKCDVIAYVNTAGTLFKATSLDKNDVKKAESLVISGYINNGDISVHDGAGDPNGNQNAADGDKFVNSATPAFYLDNTQASIKSVDMSDAEIVDYRYLRVLDAYGASLESVVFPKTVTRIPNYCCYSNSNAVLNLANVVFPTDVESFTIGDYAFYGTAIKSLMIPSTVTRVGDYAFATCPKLYDVEMEGLKDDCSFGNNVFERCVALQHVSLSEGVQNIGDYMFNQCGILESIRIPSTCKTIGSYAFQFCFEIHQVTIPEGVELIKINAFEGAGLTDIYLMATSIDKLPKIYAMKATGGQEAGPSSFSYQRTTGNNTVPANHRGDLENADYDEVMTWYQEEQSGSAGLGSGNCLTALHYPESMKPFFEAIDVTKFYTPEQLATIPFEQNPNAQQEVKKYYTPDEYLDMANPQYRSILEAIVNNEILPGYEGFFNGATRPVDFGETEYLYLPQSYAVDPCNDGSGTTPFGPDKDGGYYPSQTSYLLRMVAGATSSLAGGVGGEEIASAWGWRQFPLSSSIESINEVPFEKEYDDTWYTMAFPWKMIDNQLFSAFNQKCEIVEFKGAEMVQQDDENYSLVFHFDDVAATYYMDHEDNFYKREFETTRQINSNGVTINKNFYKYTLLDGKNGNETSTVITDPYPYNASDPDQAAMHVKYLSIENIMVLPGHPYMIHPSIGAAPGNPTKVYINGVKKVSVGGEGDKFADYEALAESQKVNKVVATRSKTDTEEWTSGDAWTTPDGKAGGSYTFIGNINDDKNGDLGKKDMPLPCYFLGVKSGTFYPKYYRRTTGGVKKWSQYSAIIVPDEAAFNNIEKFMSSSSTSTSTGAKEMGDVVFGEWEVVDAEQMATVIDNAVAEGKEKNEPAKIQHLNVVYNIKGQVVRSNSTSVEGLPKGLYIVNGKKYMVK